MKSVCGTGKSPKTCLYRPKVCKLTVEWNAPCPTGKSPCDCPAMTGEFVLKDEHRIAAGGTVTRVGAPQCACGLKQWWNKRSYPTKSQNYCLKAATCKAGLSKKK
jgi:hypothetical protein